MKFIKLVCILFLIISQSFLSIQAELKERKSKLSIKRTHFKRSKSHRNLSRMSSRIKDAINVSFEMKSDEGVLDFVLGVLATFYPPTEVFFTSKSLIKGIITPCTIKDDFKESDVTVETSPKTVESKWKTGDAADKYIYCKQRKKFFADNSQRSIGWLFDECVINDSEFKNISSKYPLINNAAEYTEECKYFKEMDCDMFSNGVDPLGFISSAMKLLSPIQKSVGCIIRKRDEILAINEFSNLTDVFSSGVLSVLGTIGGVTLQILTVGIWGLIKGAYNLAKLSKQIYEFVANKEVKLQNFMFGKITGEAINLGQSLLTGTRKRRSRKMPKN